MRVRRPKILGLYCGPRQEDIDALTQRRFDEAVARHPLAIRAAAAMRAWHADQRSEGRMAQVIPIRRRHG